MSSEGKIKSKDLSYDSALPPFLQRLHAQKAGHGDSDRHERQIARPKRAKDPNDDDGPTVVDESGEIVSKEQLEGLTKEGEKKDGGASGEISSDAQLVDPDGSQADKPRTDAKLTDGTATKKRKAAKVIVEDDAEQGGEKDKQGNDEGLKKVAKKVRRKAKPIKLAFDDDDET